MVPHPEFKSVGPPRWEEELDSKPLTSTCTGTHTKYLWNKKRHARLASGLTWGCCRPGDGVPPRMDPAMRGSISEVCLFQRMPRAQATL